MTKDEALKLALEALQPTPYKDDWTVAKETNKAITAIKEALANEALEKMAENARELGLDYEPAQKPCGGCKGSGWVTRDPDIGTDQECFVCGGSGVYPKEPEPVAWLLTDKNINSLQVDSIQRLIDRLKHAHHTDLCVRINGQDEWFQADWLKHMVRASPPQRTWVGLTEAQCGVLWKTNMTPFEYYQAIEAKLKEKNT